MNILKFQDLARCSSINCLFSISFKGDLGQPGEIGPAVRPIFLSFLESFLNFNNHHWNVEK